MLHETCLLINLSINLPPQTRVAQQASTDVEHKYRTAKKQGRVTKSLFSAKDIKPLTRVMSEARTLFNELSLPYDSAYRIIPSASYFEFVEKMAVVAKKFDTQKANFLREYHIILMRSEQVLGDLFDEDDYPTLAALENKMNFTIESSVIPAETAFDELAGLTPEAIEEMKVQARAGQQEKIEQALKDLFQRLFNSLKKASSKLADEDGIFRDTLIGNINGALAAVDSLNLTNNQELIDTAEEVKQVISGITPEELRKDKELRKHTAETTQEVLKKMSNFF